MNETVSDMIMHYGMPRRSGRYPWGSGENPYQHTKDFLSAIKEMENQGLSEKQIAAKMGLKTTKFRIQKSLASMEQRSIDVSTAKALREKGYSLNEIARKMGYKNDSSVRSLLNAEAEARMNVSLKTAEFLKKQIDEKGMIDVGIGVEKELGVTRNKLDEALYILEMEGYPTYGGRVPQLTNKDRKTTIKVAGPPTMEKKDIYNYGEIHSISDYKSSDGGDTFHKSFVYPESLDSKRLSIRYAEDGGINKDGVIELRRGVEDISLGDSVYAQVRIMVDGDKYLKGMAVYSDDLPDGVDVRFNTNKTKGTPMDKVLKKVKNDPENPFGALIKENGGQRYYIGEDGKEHLSVINKTREEGDWAKWKDKTPSQFLAKQNQGLIKQQLKMEVDERRTELNDIKDLQNPVIKKQLLMDYASKCDSTAVHLQAAALPRQKYQVMLPLENIKNNEVYAPNYQDGETVALIRFPHGGTFEIPVLKVNNRNKEGRSLMGNTPKDAIGVNKSVADRLSGADFDGDFALVVPCNSPNTRTKITSTKSLKGLVGFDPKVSYGADEVVEDKDGTVHAYRGGREFKVMGNTQIQMGIISNLITDMTLGGADEDELARAVRHSMVVIDAEKHKLDYKQSESDNAIRSLQKKYQTGGASTLISRAKKEIDVSKRRGSPRINPDGSLSYVESGETYVNKKGETVLRTQKSTLMAETSDAHTLSSGTVAEELYADYANTMKSLANEARREYLTTPRLERSAQAAKTYAKEVESLDSKLSIAESNAPKERMAQLKANARANERIAALDEEPSKKEKAKIRQQALTSARAEVGASRRDVEIDISDREWEAIQSGAISNNKLTRMIKYTNTDRLRELATPREKLVVTPVKANRIMTLANSGYTISQIADALNLSPSVVRNYLN